MKQTFKIVLHVHPVVAKWMDFNLEKIGDSYVVSKCKYYPMIVSSLSRKNLKLQSKLPNKFERFEKVFCLISDFDFYHYGFIISDYLQYKISKFIYDDIIDDMLRTTMAVYCSTGMARDKIIRQLLVEYMFEEEEMSIVNFRKIYQRNCLHKEKEFRAFIKECDMEY